MKLPIAYHVSQYNAFQGGECMHGDGRLNGRMNGRIRMESLEFGKCTVSSGYVNLERVH